MEDVYFIFKNISSENYLGIKKLPSIFKAEKDISFIEIEGRDGFLTQDLGSYRSIVKTVECIITDLTQIDYICSWLTGSGEVTFSNEPTRKYKATIKNQIEFTQLVSTYDYHKFIIQFECQPKKFSLTNNVITLTIPGTISNSGTANSNPIIKVFGTGAIMLTVNGTIINLTNVVEYVTIDSYLVDCYKDTVLKNTDMSGEFPQLVPGINNIGWSGTVTSLEITPNFCYL